MTAPADTLATPFREPASARIVSVDLLRGLTVGFMILVNNNGDNDLAFTALNHSYWNGFTPTDLVFPTFLFIMGISMVLSYSSKRAAFTPRSTQVLSILRRTALLFILGLIVNGFPYFHLSTLRIYGVLQRIAVCYLVCALLQLASPKLAPRLVLFVGALVGYWVLLRFVPIPGYGIPTRDFPLLDRDINLVAWLDRHIFPHRLFEGVRDPEGLLSDIPAIASTLLGVIAATWLRSGKQARVIVVGLASAGFVLALSGLLWSHTFPINKKLWTSSYVLFAGGLSTLLLALMYYLVEEKHLDGRWRTPLFVFGTNAITAYVFSELLSSAVSTFHVNASQSFQVFVYRHFFIHLLTPAIGSLVYSLVFVVVCFIPVWILFRNRISIKL